MPPIDAEKMALVSTARYVAQNTWPLVCKIVEIKERTVKVLWYTGSKTTEWTVYSERRGRCRTTIVEDIQRSDVYFCNFDLTSSGRLPAKAQREASEFRDLYL